MTNIDPLDLPPPQEPAPSDNLVDLNGIIRLVLDKSWLIVSCVVLGVIGAAAYVQWTPRTYEATNTILVEQQEQSVVDAKSVVDVDQRGLEIMNTVAQNLCNFALLEQVLATNNLLPPEGGKVTASGKLLTRDGAVRQFGKEVKATVRRNTRLIDIAVRNTNPKLAAQLANSLVEHYLGNDEQVEHNSTSGASTFLQEEAKRQQTNLESAEQALQNYRKETGSVSLDPNSDVVTQQLNDLHKRLTETNSSLVQAQGAYEDSLNMSTNLEDLLAYPQVASDPDVAQIRGDVAKQENEFVMIKQEYLELHPKYILAQTSLKGLKEQLTATVLKVRTRIQENLRIAYENVKHSKQGLETQVAQTETNVMQLHEVAGHFNVLKHNVEESQASYDRIIKRFGETSVAAEIKPERVRVTQSAEVPEIPVSPKVKLVFALALFGGLAVGLVLSFALETINTSFRTVDEVERCLALPVLGSVPKLPKREGAAKLVAAEDRNSAGAEVFRTMRTTLSMLGREEERRTYLFTSPLPGEGKTFTSVNFAVSLAQQGLRTLLIDMDLRRPMVEQFFTEKRNRLPGATDFFLGRKKLAEVCLQHPDVAKLSWMPAGTPVPSPLELLTQSDFEQFLKEGLTQFDRIVIDTAPLLPVSDTLLLAGKVKTVALVVHGGKTSRKAVERAVQLLKKANAPLGGVILNLLPTRRFTGGYYYSYYHGYGYGSYGKNDSKKESKKDRAFSVS